MDSWLSGSVYHAENPNSDNHSKIFIANFIAACKEVSIKIAKNPVVAWFYSLS